MTCLLLCSLVSSLRNFVAVLMRSCVTHKSRHCSGDCRLRPASAPRIKCPYTSPSQGSPAPLLVCSQYFSQSKSREAPALAASAFAQEDFSSPAFETHSPPGINHQLPTATPKANMHIHSQLTIARKALIRGAMCAQLSQSIIPPSFC
jgi:hypothetical protein